MEATTTQAAKRIPVTMTQSERELMEEFRSADRRESLAQAVRTLALIGYQAWKHKPRPAGQSLVPVVHGTPNPHNPSGPEAA